MGHKELDTTWQISLHFTWVIIGFLYWWEELLNTFSLTWIRYDLRPYKLGIKLSALTQDTYLVIKHIVHNFFKLGCLLFIWFIYLFLEMLYGWRMSNRTYYNLDFTGTELEKKTGRNGQLFLLVYFNTHMFFAFISHSGTLQLTWLFNPLCL